MFNIRYEWLLDYKELEEKIEHLKWKITKSELELERWLDPKDLGKIALERDSNSSDIEESIDKMKRSLEENEKLLESLKKIINKFDGLENQILKMKYIEGMTLKDIAIELDYSYSYIMSAHAGLMRSIKIYGSLL